MASTRTTAAGEFVCPHCGAGPFQSQHALGGHMSAKHRKAGSKPLGGAGVKRAARAATPRGSAELRDTVIGPLRKRQREINARLDEIVIEQSALRAERTDIDFVLKRLDPTSFVSEPAKAETQQKTIARSNDETKKAVVREFVEQHMSDLADGFTINSLTNDIVGVGAHVVRATVEELRDAGVVRADRVIRGGGMQFKTNVNGDTDGN